MAFTTLSVATALLMSMSARQAHAVATHSHFGEFIQTFGRDYSHGSDEYHKRFDLYQQRVAHVEHINTAGRTWSAKINAFADRTDAELTGLRGYQHQGKKGGLFGARASASFLGKSSTRQVRVPNSTTWRPHLKAMKQINDQSSCGSCWAFAASTVLRAHSELYRKDRSFSVEHIVSCTPNPNECGGQGGCQGATAELAIDYVKRMGCKKEEEWGYTGSEDTCPSNLVTVGKEHNLAKAQVGGLSSLGMRSYQKLPENELDPLMHALVDQGPVAVSIAASSEWNFYSQGIMEGCPKSDVINHAVVLTGFGEDNGHNYWQLQNSWGDFWGEAGFVRLQRQKSNKDEAQYCGWDNSPEVGSGCKGGPSKVWICGTCGILFDTVIPNFDLNTDGWWARKGLKQIEGAAKVQKPVASHANSLSNSDPHEQ